DENGCDCQRAPDARPWLKTAHNGQCYQRYNVGDHPRHEQEKDYEKNRGCRQIDDPTIPCAASPAGEEKRNESQNPRDTSNQEGSVRSEDLLSDVELILIEKEQNVLRPPDVRITENVRPCDESECAS